MVMAIGCPRHRISANLQAKDGKLQLDERRTMGLASARSHSSKRSGRYSAVVWPLAVLSEGFL